MYVDGPNGLFKLAVEACAAVLVLLLGGVVSVFSQTVLNMTSVSWPHLELVQDGSQYTLNVAGQIDVAALWPFGSELNPFPSTISIGVLDPAGRVVKTGMGTANFPQLNLKRGKNSIDFKMPLTPFDENMMFKSFIDPMFNDGKQIKIWVDAKGITMHVWGFLPIPARVMKKAMLCNAIKDPPKPPPPNSLRLMNQWKKCLDIPGGDLTNGNKLQVWDCSGASNQQWRFANGRLVSVVDPSKCLDLPGNDYTNGVQLELWDCNDLPQQQWGYDPSMGTIYLSSSRDATKCIDANAGGQVNGAVVQIWDCLGSSNQQWQYTGKSDSSISILKGQLSPHEEDQTQTYTPVTGRRLNSSSSNGKQSWSMQCFHAHLSDSQIHV